MLATLKQSKCVFCASPFATHACILKIPSLCLSLETINTWCSQTRIHVNFWFVAGGRNFLGMKEYKGQSVKVKVKTKSWIYILDYEHVVFIFPDHTCMGVSVPAHALDQLVDDKDSSFPLQIWIRIVSLSLFYQPSVGRTVLGFLVRTLITFFGFN